MYQIIVDQGDLQYTYAGEGQWALEGGLRFDTAEAAQQQLDADRWRISPRVRTRIGQVL